MEVPYIPIACSMHDQLLHYATRHDLLTVSVLVGDVQLEFEARIEDVFTLSGAEFIRFDNGNEYRLDQLLMVNGHSVLEGSCPI